MVAVSTKHTIRVVGRQRDRDMALHEPRKPKRRNHPCERLIEMTNDVAELILKIGPAHHALVMLGAVPLRDLACEMCVALVLGRIGKTESEGFYSGRRIFTGDSDH